MVTTDIQHLIDANWRLGEVIKLGIKMRAKQKQFFDTRNRNVLVECKQLEREFDNAAQSVVSPSEQATLLADRK